MVFASISEDNTSPRALYSQASQEDPCGADHAELSLWRLT